MIENKSTREKMLAHIRNALKDVKQQVPPLPTMAGKMVFNQHDEGLAERFACVFESIDGRLVRCENGRQLVAELGAVLEPHNGKQIASRSRLLEQYREEVDFGWMDAARTNEVEEGVEVGITDCEYLVASTGSIVMSTAQPAGRIFSVYVPVHIVLAQESQLVYGLDEAIQKMEVRYQNDYPSAWYLMSGPSRTGDIEKTLVLGVHGPVEVYVFLVK